MNTFFDSQNTADDYILKIRNFLVIAFSGYLFAWCMARLIDRTTYTTDYVAALETEEALDLYGLIVFKIIPIAIGLLVAVLLRPKSIYTPTVCLMLAMMTYVLVG